MVAQPFNKWDYRSFATPVPHDGPPGMVLYDTLFGRFYGCPQDQNDLGCVIVEQICGIYRRPPVAVRPGNIVVDLGSHLGTFVRMALNAGAKLVVCFEADPANAECLRATFREEIARGRVVLMEALAWSESCTLRFSGRGLVGHVNDQGDPRQAVTIDEVVRELNLPRVDFIKTAIEGAERHALKGAAEVLSMHGPRIVASSFHLPDDPAVLRDTVLACYPYTIRFDQGRQRMYCH